MKNRSKLEWVLIGILVVLLAGAGVGFAYLFSQYQAPATPEQTTVTATVDATAEALYTLVAVALTPSLTPPPGKLPTERSIPTKMVSPTTFTVDLTGTRTAAIPSHFLFGRPLDDSTPYWPVAELRYGAGTNFSARNGIHTGLDYMADYGARVYALGAGEVIWEGYGIESYLGPDNAYGVAVTIKHDDTVYDLTVYSIYAHLSVTHVVKGDRVEEGDLIGEVGLTGYTSSPHLHLEVRLGNASEFISRNPELYVRPLPGYGVLAARLLNTDGSNLYGQEIYLESLNDHKTWTANSYWGPTAISDSVYKENLVIGDLPAGQYAIIVYYGGAELHHSVFIRSGEITYFTLTGFAGYQDGLPTD